MILNRNGRFCITFNAGTDEEACIKMRELGGVTVSVDGEDGSKFTACFVTVQHLQRQIDSEDRKFPCLADINMFIVPEVTVEAVEASVEHLWQEGFFRRYAMPYRPSLKRIWQMIVAHFSFTRYYE